VIYRVTARFRNERTIELFRLLTDGSIAAQDPDGREIVASLNRAVMTGVDVVRWSEMCFCEPPLAHERSTVLDRYFDSITTEPIGAYEQYEGESFVEYLSKLREVVDGGSDRRSDRRKAGMYGSARRSVQDDGS